MKLGFGVFTLAFGLTAFAGEAFRAHVGLGLFRSFIDSPVQQSRSISDFVMGTAISGTAVTHGALTVDFLPWKDGAAFALRLATETDSHAIGVNTPRRDISVNIWSTAHTVMQSAKALHLYPDRVATAPASSSASTSLQFHGVSAEASGLFWRLKERIAHRKAWETLWATKAQNEYLTSAKAITEMNSMLDGKADPLVAKLNRYYRDYFYRPFFQEGMVPGRLGLSTSVEVLTASVWDEDTDISAPADTTSPIGFRVSERLLTRVGSKALAGRRMDDADIEEFLILNGISATGPEMPPGEPSFVIEFCDANALKVALDGGNLSLLLCAKSLELGSGNARDTNVRIDYEASVSDRGALLFKLAGIEIGVDPVSAPSCGPEPFRRRLRTLFPETLEFGPFVLPGKFGNQGDLRVKQAHLDKGWARVDWELR